MAATQTVQVPQRWEYSVITRGTEKFLVHDLNEQGQEGWELVSVDRGTDRTGALTLTAFLKRPCGKQDVAPVESALNEQIRIEPKLK
jgi:hypothetical protein